MEVGAAGDDWPGSGHGLGTGWGFVRIQIRRLKTKIVASF